MCAASQSSCLPSFQSVEYSAATRTVMFHNCKGLATRPDLMHAPLQGAVLPRETRSAAAVALSAALQMPHVPPAATALSVAVASRPRLQLSTPVMQVIETTDMSVVAMAV